jgi:hypothetical protein
VTGLWRVLILDTSDPDDPRWLIATVQPGIGDVRPAAVSPAGRYEDWHEVTQWVRRQVAPEVALIPVPGARVWRADEQPGSAR